MSEYEKSVGFRKLKLSRSPKIEEIEALIEHVENQVKLSSEKPDLIVELVSELKSENTSNSAQISEKKDIYIFNSAREFLLKESPEEITADLIERYLVPEKDKNMPEELSDVFRICLETAMKSGVNANAIGNTLGGSLDPLNEILFDCDIPTLTGAYGSNTEKLLERVRSVINMEVEINSSSKNPWFKFCRTILSTAFFLSNFRDGADFTEWTKRFSGDYRTVPALPLMLGKEIYGLGFTLACDFLIELGIEDYCRVDSTVKGLLVDTGLLQTGSDGYQTLKCLSRISQNTGSPPYTVDKAFWLIGTGYFYNHLDLGKKERGAKLKKKFLDQLYSD